MKYLDLRTLLERLEGKVPGNLPNPPGFPSADCVRDFPKSLPRSQAQAYALDTTTNGQDLPIVVTIGANYTQGDARMPRDRGSSGNEVEASLSRERKRVDDGLEEYAGNKSRWCQECAASSPKIRLPRPGTYHLVMTNFSVWITKVSWQNIDEHKRADLLQNNPLGTPGSGLVRWAHLDDLIGELRSNDESVLWIGHSIHAEIFALFRQYVALMGLQPWLLLPNLGFKYLHYGKHFP